MAAETELLHLNAGGVPSLHGWCRWREIGEPPLVYAKSLISEWTGICGENCGSAFLVPIRVLVRGYGRDQEFTTSKSLYYRTSYNERNASTTIKAAMLLSRREEKALLNVLGSLSKFESTSKRLKQADDVTLLDVRDLFDALIKLAPQVAQYLGPDSSIVQNPAFENARVRVLLGHEASIPEEQASVLSKLVSGGSRPAQSEPSPTPAREDFATDTLTNARSLRATAPRFNGHVACIAPTSNIVERFFSQAKAVLGLHRQSMTPLHLEAILFLKVNRAYWNAGTVRKIVRGDVSTA